MKGFEQIHIIARDRGFKYEPIANTPKFYNENDALKYWENNKFEILDSNFYNDPIVIIRKEISNTKTQDLYG